MRYAVLSDIHANMEALSSVLSSLKSRGVERAVCLGDVVGYGAEPREAVSSVRDWSEATVLGNHDAGAVAENGLGSFNRYAREAVEWTRGRLGDDEREFLSGCPLTERYEGALLVHASPAEPGSWTYVLEEREAEEAFAAFEGDLCFLGHSHEPCFFEQREGAVRKLPPGTIELAPGSRYIVNPGSVGQPRDGDPRASYAVADAGEKRIEIVRVPYDFREAGARIEREGLPVVLSERLATGL
ncbi:MAG: metallophosphoesterase [Candidatus Eisenbacteria bacterium]|nr:metallophosphoesterase [Candidatus Eisenbacteria bacterium]